MLPKTQDPELLLAALTTLAQSEVPTGARQLAGELARQGFQTAEATAGRLLHRLDKLGLTEGLGRQGRVLTRKGRDKLSELRLQQTISKETAIVAAAFDVTHERELLGLLFARRAIESEAARLAAIYATDEELRQLQEESATCSDADYRDRANHSKTFHTAILTASHNTLLSAVGTLLLNPEIEPAARLLLKSLSEKQGVDNAVDHAQIATAISSRDSEEAERLMRAHIDGMIAIASTNGKERPTPQIASDSIATKSARARRTHVS